MQEQKILVNENQYEELKKILESHGKSSIMVVCGQSFYTLKIASFFNQLEKENQIKFIIFDKVLPNPTYEIIKNGVKQLRLHKCEMLIAVGGGSAIDVAKCIKAFATMDSEKDYLTQQIVSNEIDLMAIPTTAGSGSEATSFAVLYNKGEKQSVSHDSCIPSVVVLDPRLLSSLPEYQRKSTMLDALCHAIESYWSVHSTQESRELSVRAIKLILQNADSYLKNTENGNRNMLLAANLAGRAINIAKTTAGHAMCYQLTIRYGIAHGHAAALCVEQLWHYMLQNISQCCDIRGEAYLKHIFSDLSDLFGAKLPQDGVAAYSAFLKKLSLLHPLAKPEDIYALSESVNEERLRNNPIKPGKEALKDMYCRIVEIAD